MYLAILLLQRCLKISIKNIFINHISPTAKPSMPGLCNLKLLTMAVDPFRYTFLNFSIKRYIFLSVMWRKSGLLL